MVYGFQVHDDCCHNLVSSSLSGERVGVRMDGCYMGFRHMTTVATVS